MSALRLALGALFLFSTACAGGGAASPADTATADVGSGVESTVDAPALGDVAAQDAAADALASDAADAPDAPPDAAIDSVADAGPAVPDAAWDAGVDGADGGLPDVEEPDAEDASPPKGALWAKITAPPSSASFAPGSSIELIGQVGGPGVAPDSISAAWTLNGVPIGEPVTPGADGKVTTTIIDAPVGTGLVVLTASLDGYEPGNAAIQIAVCEPEVLTFDADLNLADWKVYGDAHWDPGGWLELTGIEQSKAGSIYKIDHVVYPGDVSFRMAISTGGGINGGADGFAMNIYAVASIADLDALVADAKDGGCLGYGVSGPCGAVTVDSFHIEFDTFQNTGDPLSDPTFQNHIAVTLDGDPGAHVLWAAVPNLEDGQWHDVEVSVTGSVIRVFWDGETIISESVPDFLFKGGYLGFSGSTGWATNHHRIDDLEIEQGCDQP